MDTYPTECGMFRIPLVRRCHMLIRMGIKNARKRGHSSRSTTENTDEGKWQEGSFKPVADCEEKKIPRPINGLDGLSIEGARKMYVAWKKGSELQKFYQCIQMNYDNDVDFEVPADDDDAESKLESTGQEADCSWNGAEIDCSHSICHMHPNGHRPPSGKVEPKRLIKKLDCVEDVRESNKRASRIISSTVTRIVREYGGDFSESNVTRAAIQALS